MVIQSQNKNAFQEILLDISLCYNAIYVLAKGIGDLEDLEDLWECSLFMYVTNSHILNDQ